MGASESTLEEVEQLQEQKKIIEGSQRTAGNLIKKLHKKVKVIFGDTAQVVADVPNIAGQVATTEGCPSRVCPPCLGKAVVPVAVQSGGAVVPLAAQSAAAQALVPPTKQVPAVAAGAAPVLASPPGLPQTLSGVPVLPGAFTPPPGPPPSSEELAAAAEASSLVHHRSRHHRPRPRGRAHYNLKRGSKTYRALESFYLETNGAPPLPYLFQGESLNGLGGNKMYARQASNNWYEKDI